MRKEFQWPLVYLGSFITFVAFPWATNEFQEQLRDPSHTLKIVQALSLATAFVYGWAMLALVNSKQRTSRTLWAICGLAFFFFLFGQLVDTAPPHQWTVAMFSIACGIVCAGTVHTLFRNKENHSEN